MAILIEREEGMGVQRWVVGLAMVISALEVLSVMMTTGDADASCQQNRLFVKVP